MIAICNKKSTSLNRGEATSFTKNLLVLQWITARIHESTSLVFARNWPPPKKRKKHHLSPLPFRHFSSHPWSFHPKSLLAWDRPAWPKPPTLGLVVSGSSLVTSSPTCTTISAPAKHSSQWWRKRWCQGTRSAAGWVVRLQNLWKEHLWIYGMFII